MECLQIAAECMRPFSEAQLPLLELSAKSAATGQTILLEKIRLPLSVCSFCEPLPCDKETYMTRWRSIEGVSYRREILVMCVSDSKLNISWLRSHQGWNGSPRNIFCQWDCGAYSFTLGVRLRVRYHLSKLMYLIFLIMNGSIGVRGRDDEAGNRPDSRQEPRDCAGQEPCRDSSLQSICCRSSFCLDLLRLTLNL